MKFTASRLSEGNKIFPAEIHCEEHGLTVKIPGLFSGESQYFDYKQISSVGVDTPLIGFSTITFYASGNFISAHGFTTNEVNEIKQAINSGKVIRIKSPDTTKHQETQKGIPSFNSIDPTDQQIIDLVNEGKKLEAVKLCREISGMEIADAKAYVESLTSQTAITQAKKIDKQQNRIEGYTITDNRSDSNKLVYKRNSTNEDDSDIFTTLLNEGRQSAIKMITERYGYDPISYLLDSEIIYCLDEDDGLFYSESKAIKLIQQDFILSETKADFFHKELRRKYRDLRDKAHLFSKENDIESAIGYYMEKTNESRDNAIQFIDKILFRKHKEKVSGLVKDGKTDEAIRYIEQNTHHKGDKSVSFMNEAVEQSKGCMSIVLLIILFTIGLIALSTVITQAQNGITIGNQFWMNGNLNIERLANGDLIREAKSLAEWNSLCNDSIPTWCYYNFDPKLNQKHGKLYNYFAVIDKRRIAPTGWHIPDDEEWTKLIEYLGGNKTAGKKLKSQVDWVKGSGTNMSGFSALPCGFLECEGSNEQDECFRGLGTSVRWWSSTRGQGAEGDIAGNYLAVFDHTDEVDFNSSYDRTSGFAIRCLKNK